MSKWYKEKFYRPFTTENYELYNFIRSLDDAERKVVAYQVEFDYLHQQHIIEVTFAKLGGSEHET